MRRAVTMRLAILLSAGMLLLAAAPALAHNEHYPCQNSKSLTKYGFLHVDLYNRDCIGVTVSSDAAWCAFDDYHVFYGIHNPVLHGYGCETGLIVELVP